MDDSSKSAPSSNKHLVSVYHTSVLVTHVNDAVVHVKVPPKLIGQTIVPGIAAGAEVELVLLKDQQALSDNLHLLGTRWLADMLGEGTNPWLHELIGNSILMSSWCRQLVWVATPLERKNDQEYCMPMVDPKSNNMPLMNCSSTIIADQFSGVTENTLSICPNSINFLMGECKLGCSYCSIGLGSASTK